MYTRIRPAALAWPAQLRSDTVGAGTLQSTIGTGTACTAGAGAMHDGAGAGVTYLRTGAGSKVPARGRCRGDHSLPRVTLQARARRTRPLALARMCATTGADAAYTLGAGVTHDAARAGTTHSTNGTGSLYSIDWRGVQSRNWYQCYTAGASAMSMTTGAGSM